MYSCLWPLRHVRGEFMLVAGRIEVIVDREADSFELLTVPFLFSYLLSQRCLFINGSPVFLPTRGCIFILSVKSNVHAGSIYIKHIKLC